MMLDISLVFSDDAKLDDPRVVLYLNRDAVARWYNTYPKIIDEMDAFDYNFGLWCMQATQVAEQRLQIRKNIQGMM